MQKPKFDSHHLIIVGKTLVIQTIIFISLIFLVWGTQKIYSAMDQTVFPQVFELAQTPSSNPQMTESEKGVLLIDALTNRLVYELNSTFGWSAILMLFNKCLLDNRVYRQFGPYVATIIRLTAFTFSISTFVSS